MNKRRKLLTALGAGALAVPFTSFPQQQGKVWRIGVLFEREAEPDFVQWIDAFKVGIREFGYVEGKDYVIEQRTGQNDLSRLPAMAAELLALKVDLIVPTGTPSAVAAHNSTHKIPIVIAVVGDPVGIGLATSLSHPSGNVTGLTSLASGLVTKRLDLLRQILPGMRRAGFLYNPDNGNDSLGLKQFESDCAELKFKSVRAPLRKEQEVPTAFSHLKRDQTQGLLVSAAGTNIAWRESIIAHAAKHRLPAIYSQSIHAESGGLISYAPNFPDLYRRAAAYVAKIFKGARPGDLPIEQPNKYETLINLKTAKALGINIPDVILLRADKVIE